MYGLFLVNKDIMRCHFSPQYGMTVWRHTPSRCWDVTTCACHACRGLCPSRTYSILSAILYLPPHTCNHWLVGRINVVSLRGSEPQLFSVFASVYESQQRKVPDINVFRGRRSYGKDIVRTWLTWVFHPRFLLNCFQTDLPFCFVFGRSFILQVCRMEFCCLTVNCSDTWAFSLVCGPAGGPPDSQIPCHPTVSWLCVFCVSGPPHAHAVHISV